MDKNKKLLIGEKKLTMDIIIPIIKDDIESFKFTIKYIKKYLTYEKIIVIGKNELEEEIKKIDFLIKFIDEDKLVDKMNLEKIKEIIVKRGGNSKRAGWYFQQFLKMGYSLSSEASEVYLIWDSDLIPLKEIKYDSKNLILKTKKEYHKVYFETLKKLLGYKKQIKRSFICEHMLIKKSIMRNLINEIEKNSKIEGECFYEKIINAISEKDLNFSGFSEFETYGTYVLLNYPEVYKLEKIETFRFGAQFFEKEDFFTNNLLRKEFTKKYYGILFEKWHRKYKRSYLIYNKTLMRIFGVKLMIKIIQKLK